MFDINPFAEHDERLDEQPSERVSFAAAGALVLSATALVQTGAGGPALLGVLARALTLPGFLLARATAGLLVGPADDWTLATALAANVALYGLAFHEARRARRMPFVLGSARRARGVR